MARKQRAAAPRGAPGVDEQMLAELKGIRATVQAINEKLSLGFHVYDLSAHSKLDNLDAKLAGIEQWLRQRP